MESTEGILDGRDQPCIIGCHVGSETGHHGPITANQEFLEIPGHIARLGRQQIAICQALAQRGQSWAQEQTLAQLRQLVRKHAPPGAMLIKALVE